jgi:hypothetical protein
MTAASVTTVQCGCDNPSTYEFHGEISEENPLQFTCAGCGSTYQATAFEMYPASRASDS